MSHVFAPALLAMLIYGGAALAQDPQATSPAAMKVAKGFKVELLYSVPKEQQGSWVSMCVDPKGRLILSDQYGKLYRVTVPAAGGDPASTKVEPIDLEIGEAQGLLWAFDSLYVSVNRGQKYASGLYRVRDTDGDDRLDKVELLRKIEGSSEHGPHSVILTADGRGLYVVAGNHTKLTPIDGSRVTQAWQEDHLLPRMWDGRGHAKGILAPGGWICRTDPDGKSWELVSIGYRNGYDLALNRDGEILTFDSDMEWDFNMPWYRPTRVCHAVSGSEFGWRSGSGKWPAYYPDSLPAAVDIGPGSPTGVTFGYGAKFPAKFQEALYICDWSYGKLYAVHLEPDGSSWRGKAEEFITGAPLPLTDLLIHPDGAMYFAIGGRKVKSGLYRVTYAGSESTAPSKGEFPGAEARALRRRLEAFHGRKDPAAVEAAWPHLGHADRFIRWAARTAIEQQDPATWRDRALAEKSPQAALEALVALARMGEKSLQPKLLEALDRIGWAGLSGAQKLSLLRIYGLAFVRMGKPDEAARERAIRRFDPLYPAADRDLNSELCQMLVHLEAPGAAAKSVALLEKAPTQEERMEYLRCLRTLRTGWTPELRKTYFTWLYVKSASFRGGHSLGGFLGFFKADALATLSEAEKAELRPILETKPPAAKPLAALQARAFVRKWTMADLAPVVEKGLKGRSFERGHSLFALAGCFTCHRFAGDGGAFGPDLTGAVGRFSPRDLLESVIEPSKVISDQYEGVLIRMQNGAVITGRIVNLNGDNVMVNTDMTDPDANAAVDRRKIETMVPSKVSMMPEGLLDTLKEDEVLDLVAYLLSSGDPKSPVFR